MSGMPADVDGPMAPPPAQPPTTRTMAASVAADTLCTCQRMEATSSRCDLVVLSQTYSRRSLLACSARGCRLAPRFTNNDPVSLAATRQWPVDVDFTFAADEHASIDDRWNRKARREPRTI